MEISMLQRCFQATSIRPEIAPPRHTSFAILWCRRSFSLAKMISDTSLHKERITCGNQNASSSSCAWTHSAGSAFICNGQTFRRWLAVVIPRQQDVERRQDEEREEGTDAKPGRDRQADMETAHGTCTGGQQQRTFLARALVQDADLYLMDEPFAAVDADKTVLGVSVSF